MKIGDQTHVLGEWKKVLDDQGCPNKNNMHYIRAHCIMCLSGFLTLRNVCSVYTTPQTLSHKQVKGIGRHLSSEKIAQAVDLDNFSNCQRYIIPRLWQGCSIKQCKTLDRQTGYIQDKPGRWDPVSQLLTEKLLSHSGLKTRRSRLFTSIQVVQI